MPGTVISPPTTSRAAEIASIFLPVGRNALAMTAISSRTGEKPAGTRRRERGRGARCPLAWFFVIGGAPTVTERLKTRAMGMAMTRRSYPRLESLSYDAVVRDPEHNVVAIEQQAVQLQDFKLHGYGHAADRRAHPTHDRKRRLECDRSRCFEHGRRRSRSRRASCCPFGTQAAPSIRVPIGVAEDSDRRSRFKIGPLAEPPPVRHFATLPAPVERAPRIRCSGLCNGGSTNTVRVAIDCSLSAMTPIRPSRPHSAGRIRRRHAWVSSPPC